MYRYLQPFNFSDTMLDMFNVHMSVPKNYKITIFLQIVVNVNNTNAFTMMWQ